MVYSLSFNSFSNRILRGYINYLKFLFKDLKIKHSIFFLPKKKKRKVLLRSPHVNKKSKETYEFCLHKSLVLVKTDINFLKVLKNNIPTIIHFKYKVKV